MRTRAIACAVGVLALLASSGAMTGTGQTRRELQARYGRPMQRHDVDDCTTITFAEDERGRVRQFRIARCRECLHGFLVSSLNEFNPPELRELERILEEVVPLRRRGRWISTSSSFSDDCIVEIQEYEGVTVELIVDDFLRRMDATLTFKKRTRKGLRR